MPRAGKKPIDVKPLQRRNPNLKCVAKLGAKRNRLNKPKISLSTILDYVQIMILSISWTTAQKASFDHMV